MDGREWKETGKAQRSPQPDPWLFNFAVFFLSSFKQDDYYSNSIHPCLSANLQKFEDQLEKKKIFLVFDLPVDPLRPLVANSGLEKSSSYFHTVLLMSTRQSLAKVGRGRHRLAWDEKRKEKSWGIWPRLAQQVNIPEVTLIRTIGTNMKCNTYGR